MSTTEKDLKNDIGKKRTDVFNHYIQLGCSYNKALSMAYRKIR